MPARKAPHLDLDEIVPRVRKPLARKKPDFAASRAALPDLGGRTRTISSLALASNETHVERGDLRVRGSLLLEPGAKLCVLGDLTVGGGIYSRGSSYSVVVVAGAVRAKRIRTAAELFALGGLEAEVVWGEGNDFSTYSPTVRCKTYVALDRHDVLGNLMAKTQVHTDAEAQRIFPWYRPGDDDKAIDARTKGERAFFVGKTAKPRARTPRGTALADLRRMLAPVPLAELKKHRAVCIARWEEAKKILIKSRPKALAGDVAAHVRWRSTVRTNVVLSEWLIVLGLLGGGEEILALVEDKVSGLRNIKNEIANAFELAGWKVTGSPGQWIVHTKNGRSVPL